MRQSEVAREMYRWQECCKKYSTCNCPNNMFDMCDRFLDCINEPPSTWGITKADIERLKKQEIETFTCKDCRHYQCRVSVFSTSKICERFELWQ